MKITETFIFEYYTVSWSYFVQWWKLCANLICNKYQCCIRDETRQKLLTLDFVSKNLKFSLLSRSCLVLSRNSRVIKIWNVFSIFKYIWYNLYAIVCPLGILYIVYLLFFLTRAGEVASSSTVYGGRREK